MNMKKIFIKVPASIGNVGSGFDCAGLSLKFFNKFIVEKSEKNNFILHNKISTEAEKTTGEFFMLAFNSALKYLGEKEFNVKVKMVNEIPFRRGFGSSGTVVLGGIIGAVKCCGYEISKEEILKISLNIEEHLDNLAASLYGGFVFGFNNAGEIKTYKISPDKDLRIVSFIPEYQLSTSDARKVLPEKVPIKDAVYNLCNFGFLCMAFSSQNFKLLGYGTQDRLHQPYRQPLMPYLDKFTIGRSKAIFGACLSGAGPSIAFFTNKKFQKDALGEVKGMVKKDNLEGEVKVFAAGSKTIWKVLN